MTGSLFSLSNHYLRLRYLWSGVAPFCMAAFERTVLLLLLLCCSVAAMAGPWIDPGDSALRSDLQRLAAADMITTPLTTWPLAWGDLQGELSSATALPRNSAVRAAFNRVQRRMRDETRSGSLSGALRLAGTNEPEPVRGFDDGPREAANVEAALEWTGDLFAWRLDATAVSNPDDDRSYRADGSYLGMAVGNWMLSVGQMARWWGPGWDGSLILSTNARPIPAIAFERNQSDPFESPLLSWIGPWKLVLFNGWLEENRDHANAMLLGIRFTFMPTHDLELGLSRTAQWGGEGRPQDANTVVDLLLGKDNFGSNGITIDNQPGNQLAGFDMRWNAPLFDLPYALYGQAIGEDSAGGLPSRYIYLGGLEWWGDWGVDGSAYRLILEYADTQAGGLDNVAYNHHLYTDGYRYHQRSMGHGIDGDSQLWSSRLIFTPINGQLWEAALSTGKINRDNGGLNTLSNNAAADYRALRLTHRRPLWIGEAELSLGHLLLETGPSRHDGLTAAASWQHKF